MRSATAIRRLQKDLRECQLEPLPDVVGFPVFDNNMLEWHANIRCGNNTPYAGLILHLVFDFLPDYPLVGELVSCLNAT